MPESWEPVVICVSSGKGGVGKTSLSVNLGVALTMLEQRVLIVDGDLGLANVDVLLGLSVQRTIQDILEKGDDPTLALLEPLPNLCVLPASSGVPDMVSLDPDDQGELKNILRSIAAGFDYVILDTAAGIGSSVLWFNSFADHNIIVMTPDPTSLTDAYALIKVLSRDYGRTRFHLLLNLVSGDQEGRQTYETMARVMKQFLKVTPEYLGYVPQDKVVVTGVRSQSPFMREAPSSKAAQAVMQLAQRIRILKTPS